jgi:hypothetical protein
VTLPKLPKQAPAGAPKSVIYYKTCNEFGWKIVAAAAEEIVATQNFTWKKLIAVVKNGIQKLMLQCQIYSCYNLVATDCKSHLLHAAQVFFSYHKSSFPHCRAAFWNGRAL